MIRVDILKYLISDFASIALVIVTLAYVIIIRWQTNLLRKSVESAYRPVIIVYLIQSDLTVQDLAIIENENFGKHRVSITLCIENIGRGVARNIRCDVDNSFAPFGIQPLEYLELFGKEIALLAPGQKIPYHRDEEKIVAYSSQPIDMSQTRVNIDVIYEDLENNKYCESCPVDFGQSDYP